MHGCESAATILEVTPREMRWLESPPVGAVIAAKGSVHDEEVLVMLAIRVVPRVMLVPIREEHFFVLSMKGENADAHP